MNKEKRCLLVTLILGGGLLLALWGLAGGDVFPMALAQPGEGIVRVAISGSDAPGCGAEAAPCRTIQYAVDQALSGEKVLVAAGLYTGVHQLGGLTQTVYISKTVSVRGGYTTTNWLAPDPEANPTTLDAGGQGRVLVISGTITPTIEGLRLTGGDATGQGGDPWGDDAGGGLYIYLSTATISNCVIYDNIASTADDGSGGGAALVDSAATLRGNRVQDNVGGTAAGYLGAGGGLYLYGNTPTLRDNTVQDNVGGTTFGGDGGGLYLRYSDALLVGNTVVSNTANTGVELDGNGGGLYLWVSAAKLDGNFVRGNVASPVLGGHGGGLYLRSSPATLSGNQIQGNTAGAAGLGEGGGVYLLDSDATLSGNQIEGNTASTAADGFGGGLHLHDSDVTLSGNFIVSNTATLSPTASGRGGGLSMWYGSVPTLINNLVAGNQANSQGNGLWFGGEPSYPTDGRLLHTTIADNATSQSGSGQGVYVGSHATVAFTNTIIAGHPDAGIIVFAGGEARLEATLWHDNPAIEAGGILVTGTINIYDDPAFVDPLSGDYHLSSGSAARDWGIDAGVPNDMDGQLRPYQAPDLGADEYWPSGPMHLYLPQILKYAP